MKQRIYKKNKDVLMQLDRTERIDKVEETLGDQAGDYERLLRALAGNGGADVQVGVRRDRGKRKIIDDDEDMEVEEGPDGDVELTRKRRREDAG